MHTESPTAVVISINYPPSTQKDKRAIINRQKKKKKKWFEHRFIIK